MHELVAEEVERVRSGPPLPAEEWREVMERSFSRMDAAVARWGGEPQNASCRCEMQTPKCDHVGSTAVVAVVGHNHIVVANCGDSRAVLSRNGVPIPLSSDHKVSSCLLPLVLFFLGVRMRSCVLWCHEWMVGQPDRPDELDRIQEAGGRVIYWDGARVFGVLAMSRAIGEWPVSLLSVFSSCCCYRSVS